jgi:transposase
MAATKTRAKDEVEEPKESRKAQMRRLVKEGHTRKEVADMLGVTYQTVYSSTSDLTPPPSERGGFAPGAQRVMLEVDGEQVARSEWIRQQHAAGKTRGEILKDLKALPGQEDATFQTVYASTKPPASERRAAKAKTKNGTGAEASADEDDDEELVDLDEDEATEGDKTLFP